jgi:UDP-N-acetylglucosamine 1-carboxyvinyltransferase
MKKLRDTGAKITSNRNSILIEMSGKKSKAVDIKTAPYPGLPTDMQALFTALSTVSEGTCFLEETIFENRFMHVQELKRMGADISVKDNIARVVGIQNLYGAEVMASDLRASAALIIAGLVASGKTTVFGIEHTDRGYENIDLKLASLGADIVRI